MDRDAEIGMEEGAGPAAGERQQSLPRSEDNKGTTPRHTWLLLSSVLHADPLKVRLAFCVARGLLACSGRSKRLKRTIVRRNGPTVWEGMWEKRFKKI